jgi:hypothetical protein
VEISHIYDFRYSYNEFDIGIQLLCM